MKFFACLLVLLIFSGCAVPGKGILLSVEPATPLDDRDLRSFCDLGDKAACALNASEESAKPPAKFAIVQGVAMPDRAVFSALIPKDLVIAWFVYDRDLNRLWKLHDSRKQVRPGSAWYVQRVEARALEAGRTYELLAGDPDGNLIEDRHFQTVPQDGNLRFGVVSGLQLSSKENVDRLLSLAVAKNPRLLLFTGANLNAAMLRDKLPEKRGAALDYFFERHIDARNALAFARERKLLPIAATWSEAEFGLIGGDRTFAFKDQAREVFDMFFPLWADEDSIINGPGVSKIIRVGSQTLALLDDRSFRVPESPLPICEPKMKKGKNKTECREASATPPPTLNRFGKMQSEWVFRHSLRAKQVIWLISAEPWLGIYRAGSSNPASGAEWIAQLTPPAFVLSNASGFVLVEGRESGGASLSLINADGVTVSSREIAAP